MKNIRKGVVNFVQNNDHKMQKLQIEGISGETANGVEHFQPFGFTSYIMPVDPETGKGCECILVDVFGDGHQTVISATDRRYRPTHGNQGDVMLFSIHDDPTKNHDEALQRLVFTNDGAEAYRFLLKLNNVTVQVSSDNVVHITNGNGTVTIGANGEIMFNTPKFKIMGDVEIVGTVTANGKVIDDTHKHTGVTAGSAQTGTVA